MGRKRTRFGPTPEKLKDLLCTVRNQRAYADFQTFSIEQYNAPETRQNAMTALGVLYDIMKQTKGVKLRNVSDKMGIKYQRLWMILHGGEYGAAKNGGVAKTQSVTTHKVFQAVNTFCDILEMHLNGLLSHIENSEHEQAK